ncbi:MAG: PspC domain-containing protein [Clostridia bacterium]|nr:PspC domain-containing protein [Clostridia bacterium]
MEKRLYLSEHDRKIAGVCGGIGEYFNIDPTLIRIAWIIFILMGGSGFIAYLIAWFVIPSRIHGYKHS